MADTENTAVSKESLWYVDNYIVLLNYYDRTISRIAARCVRMGNIAIEEYKFYPYILDVLEEICDTGNYILEHEELYPYVEKKIAGGVEALKKNLALYQQELTNNQSPAVDPTAGAGMNIDDLMNKLMAENSVTPNDDFIDTKDNKDNQNSNEQK